MDFTDRKDEEDSASSSSNGSSKNLGLASTDACFKKSAILMHDIGISNGIDKISKFIDMHHISLDNFWTSSRNHANCEDIKEFCSIAGIRLTSQDEVDIMNRLFFAAATVSINEFVEQITPWKENHQQIIMEFFKNRTEKLADTMKKKVRLNSASHYRMKEQPKQQPSDINPKLRRPMSSSNININKSREYLRMQKKKQIEVEKKLQVAINKAKDEYEYQLLIKMGEANDLNKQLQSVTTYRAYKNAQGNLKVRVFNLDRFERQLKLEEFQREFNNLKKKYNQTKKISVWQVLSNSRNEKNIPESKNDSVNHKSIKKTERQKELISILTETMNLTNLLKGQLKILKMHGIYSKV